MLRCRGKYDVVVAEGFGGSRIPRLAPFYVHERVIAAWHQLHSDLFADQSPGLVVGPLRLFERITAWFHRNTLVQAYTQEWKEAFPTIGFKEDNIFVVPVSIRDAWFDQAKRPVQAIPTIIWIGKVRRYKRPDHVILAMAQVVKSVPNARLLIVGRRDDAKYEAQLRRLVRDLALEGNVEFRLNVSEEEKRDLLRRSSLLVLPSAVEGFGIVVLEANACGVPVVASTGVPCSVVYHERNGLRYSFGDID